MVVSCGRNLYLVGIDREALPSMVLLDIASMAKRKIFIHDHPFDHDFLRMEMFTPFSCQIDGRCMRIQAHIHENDDTMKGIMKSIANSSPHVLHFRLVGETRITAELYCLVEVHSKDELQNTGDVKQPGTRRKRALCNRSWFEDFPQISGFRLEGLVNILSFEDTKMVLIDRSRDAAMFRI
jgi:hypothetical protein